MKYPRPVLRPFPRRRTDTITRANVNHFVALWDDTEPPDALTIALGILRHHAKPRHVERVQKLRKAVDTATDPD